MTPDQQEKLLLYSILSHIKKSRPSQTENLQVASEMLLSLYDTNQKDLETYVHELCQKDEQNDSWIVASLDLDKIFEEGVRVLKEREVEENKSPEFQAFIKALTDRGYFKSSDGSQIPRGTPAYNERFQKAKQRFKQKEQSNKQEAENHKLKGNALMRERKYEEAVEAYKKAIESDPSNAVYYANMSAAYISNKSFEKAIDAGKKALELDSSYAKAAFRIGSAYDQMNKKEEALKFYKQAAELDPSEKKYSNLINKLENPTPAANPFGAGGQGGMPPGMPDFSQMFGGAGGQGGMPDMGEMFNNPQFMQMAQNLMQNDEFRKVTESMMSNMGFNPKEISDKLVSAIEEDDEAQGEKVQAMLKDIREKGPDAIQTYAQDPEIVPILERAREKIMPGMSDMMGQFMGGGQ